ncbi:MAG: hypothetical protein AAF490_08860 [Chloroflexota bacterium]
MEIQAATEAIMPKANVVGVGIGYKTQNGEIVRDSEGNPIQCIVVSVARKVALETLSVADRVPEMFMDEPTDVIETGPISVISELPGAVAVNPRERIRPIQPGISTGLNPGVTAGTIGLLVRKSGDPNTYMLSNWHVIAANNVSVNERDVVTITQPGNFDGGRTPDDVIALLSDFVPIKSGSGGGGAPSGCGTAAAVAWLPNLIASAVGSNTRLVPMSAAVPEMEGNLVDAALARLTVDEFDLALPEIGQVTGTGEPTLGMRVQKFGRTTDFTVGTITQVNATFEVSGYPNGNATFTNQVAMTADSGPFLQGGDSGSSLISEDNKMVGLCFAGSNTIGIANTWENVASLLNISPIFS